MQPKQDNGPLILLIVLIVLLYFGFNGTSLSPPPFKVKQLSVVFIVNDNKDTNPLTTEQENTINNNGDDSIRGIVRTEGGAVRLIDHNNTTSNDPWVQEAMTKFKAIQPEPPLPYMMAGNSKSGWVGTILGTEAENVSKIRSLKEKP